MVDYVEWHETRREIPDEDVSEFYDAPLDELTLFRYSVEQFALDDHRTHFSLKITLKGREDYFFGRRRVSLVPGAVLFANDGETHGSAVEAAAESLSIYAPGADAKELIRAALTPIEKRLDDPFASDGSRVVQSAIAVSPATSSRCNRLLCALSALETDAIESAAASLIETALCDAFDAAPPAALRDIRRRSARDELVARVLRAKTMIDDGGGASYDLDALSREACLSKYHLLRAFAEVVGETPGAYARRRRLEAARAALHRGDDVTRVARRAGYRSLRRFRDAYGKAFGAVH